MQIDKYNYSIGNTSNLKKITILFVFFCSFFYCKSQDFSTRENCIKYVRDEMGSLSSLPKKYTEDREIVLLAMENGNQESDVLDFVSKNLKADKEVVEAALRSNYSAFEYADKTLKSDREFILKIINEGNPYIFPFVNDKLKNDKEIVLPWLVR